MRFVKLTTKEKKKLEYLYKMSENSVVRQRCFYLLYSNQKKSIKELSEVTGTHRRTLERFFNKWEAAIGNEKFKALTIGKGRGAKPKLETIKKEITSWVQEEKGLSDVLTILEEQYDVKVTKPTLQKFIRQIKRQKNKL